MQIKLWLIANTHKGDATIHELKHEWFFEGWQAILFLFYSPARTLRQVSVSFIACMASWNTAAQCGGATTLPMSRSDPPRREQISTTRTCQVRVRQFSAILTPPSSFLYTNTGHQFPASKAFYFFCITWTLSHSRSVWTLAIFILCISAEARVQPFFSLQCHCCQWTYTMYGHLLVTLVTLHAHYSIYCHSPVNLYLAAAMDQCLLTISSAASAQHPTNDCRRTAH